MRFPLNLSIIAGLLLINSIICKDNFKFLSKTTFPLDKCIPYAYADFNADKLTDIFCVSESGDEIRVWLAQEKSTYFQLYKVYNINQQIVNIVPSDFNGDSVIDLLVVYNDVLSNGFKIKLMIGAKASKNENDLVEDSNIEKLNLVFKDQPLAVDVNGDGITDLVGQDEEGKHLFIFNDKGFIVKRPLTGDDLFVGYSNSVADMNGDYKFDLILATNHKNRLQFELWINNDGQFDLNQTYDPPVDALIVGQSIFADFDSDGSIEHLLPICLDVDCKKSSIYVHKDNSWSDLKVDFHEYSFIPHESDSQDEWKRQKISMKFADYDLSGFIDLLIIMHEPNNNERVPVLLKSIDSSKTSNGFGRTFKIDTASNLLAVKNIVQASFFDINEDGSLDVLLLREEQDQVTKSTSIELLGFKNELSEDVYFLKVMVIPGRCQPSKCPNRSLPYGLSYPSPLIRIESKSFDWKKVGQYSTQLSQSSHFSLQLPFIIFGLGSAPNFVDRLIVGIQSNAKGPIETLTREWLSIVPNSQLVISVNPRDNPEYWKMKLFITPSKNINLIAIALGSTMVCLIIMIIVLQWKEKKEDEKKSQRFYGL